MGLSASKEFSDLYIAENGAATSEENLKKLKIVHILASGIPSPKNNQNWKNLELANNNEQTTIINLKAGARFIQQGRVNKENVLIVVDPKNNDSTAFLVAYFMLLSGLPVKCAKEAVSKLNEKVKATSQYDKELEAIRNSNTTKALRDELLKTAGDYPQDALADDVKKIYRLANITPPSPEEIRLEDARRISIIEAAWAKANQEKELADKVEKSKRFSTSSPSPSPGAKISFLKRFSMDLKKDSTPETKTEKEEQVKVTEEVKQTEITNQEEFAKPQPDDIKVSVQANKSGIWDSPLKKEPNRTSPVKANADIPSKPMENGSFDEVKKPHRVSIIYALSTESTESDAVDEYLRTHSEEERLKTRKRVTITRALTKTED